jgi:hypothetical protein
MPFLTPLSERQPTFMKKLWFIVISLSGAFGWLAWYAVDAGRHVAVDSAPISWKGAPPTHTLNDGEEIFKKAFWRRPSKDDEIQQAERHEWRDADRLERWQWFLVVSASPELTKHLRDDNAFGLVPTSVAPVISQAPAWFRFKPEDVTVLQAPHAGMRLMFSKTDNLLYATDSGRGFTKGAPEPVKQAAPPSASGRLPTTPPPISKP